MLGLDVRDVGTDRLPWWKLAAVLQHLPAGSATARAVHGDRAVWSLTDHLLASILDAINAGNWQRGGKGPKPKPTPRPGVEDGQARRRFGGRPMSLAAARERFRRR